MFDHAPKRLIKALQEAGSERKLAKKLDVNISYISNYLRRGIEPTDKTERGREIRAKLFLPRSKRRPYIKKDAPTPPSPEWWERVEKHSIRVMVRETRRAVIRNSNSKYRKK